jgi:hypothetical protein
MATTISPRMEANAFRIWQFANPREWDCSIEEIEAATGIRAQTIGYALAVKGWKGRLRAGRSEKNAAVYMATRPDNWGTVGGCGLESLTRGLA